jgi:hypothetical protein
MLLISFFGMTRYGHTHKFENIGSSRETRTLLPHPPVNPDNASLGFHLFRTLRDAIYGKRFVCDGKVNEEVAASTEFKFVQKGDRCSCFMLVQGC